MNNDLNTLSMFGQELTDEQLDQASGALLIAVRVTVVYEDGSTATFTVWVRI